MSTKKKVCFVKVLRPQKTQITTSVLAGRAFTDLLYLVCSVNRPFNDGERNSRSIIIPKRPPPFLKQLCSKVTAAITAGSSSSRTPFKQVSSVVNGLTLLHRYYQNVQMYSMFFWLTASSARKGTYRRQRASCLYTAVPLFTYKPIPNGWKATRQAPVMQPFLINKIVCR